jgi:hypothetical protein
VADAPRRSRSYVLASLRALHLDLQLVAGNRAAVEESGVQAPQLASHPRWGHFKPTSDVSDSRWGHLGPPRWVHWNRHSHGITDALGTKDTETDPGDEEDGEGKMAS